MTGRNRELLTKMLRSIPLLKTGLNLLETLISHRQGDVINIELNSTCGVRCVWCSMQNFNKIKRGSMTLEQFTKIIEKNKNYLRKKRISIEPYGRGEPLLYPDFWVVCDVLKKNSIRNNGINTNLSLKIEPDNFLKYKMPIIVNIGGTTKEIHEKMMRGSDFELVINNLKKLWSLGVPATIKMNPTKFNINQLKELPEFVESLGGKREFIIPYTTAYPVPSSASQEELDFFFENIISEDVNDHLRFTYDLSKPDKGIKTKLPGCHFLRDIVFFDGQYSICCHDQLQMIDLGNVFETTIEKIRDSDKYAQAIETAKQCGFPFCKECN